MKKYTLLLLLSFLLSANIFAQGIVGKWKTFDDKTKAITSIFEIYEDNGAYYGKILLILNEQNKDICKTCEGKYHNKSLKGIVILNDLVKNGEIYEDGNITDPQNAKNYSCNVELITKNKLKIRGYIGFSIFGRTQYWYRVTKQEELDYNNKIN